MRGSIFLNDLYGTFPGIFKAAYKDRPLNDEGDKAVCALLLPLAQLVGAHLTPEVCAKARHAAGIVAYRQTRRNGVKPDLAPAPEPGPVEQQLPLQAAESKPSPTAILVSGLERMLAELRAAEGGR